MQNKGIGKYSQKQTYFYELYKDYAYLFLIVITVVVFDQWTKGLIRENLLIGETWNPIKSLTPYARIVHWKNTGAAFGIFQSGGGVFTILAILVSIGIVIYYPEIPKVDKFLRLALAMQMGGAIGNLTDRLTIGWVTDFVSVGNFPVFNVADASISIGLALILVELLPELPHEISRGILFYRSKKIISRNRKNISKIESSSRIEIEEIISLGVLETVLDVSPIMNAYLLHLRAKRIRQRYGKRIKSKKHSE